MKGINLVFILFFLFSCKNEPAPVIATPPEFSIQVPEGFPQVPFPDDNKPTQARIELGKKLFFDPILSKDSTISCSSCHIERNAFTQNSKVAVGVHDSLGHRNVLSLTNVAYNSTFFWDGGTPTLELQAIAPIVSPFEMQEDIENVIKKLARHPNYPSLFDKAYARGVDEYSLIRALASFERTILSGNSAYDTYLKDSTTFSAKQLEGKRLFFSEKTNCSKCHSGFNFTNQRFENNGLYEQYSDEGRQRVTARIQDRAKFKVPTLRNVALTAPYMHDGSLESLEAVIAHYNSGGASNPQKSTFVRPLGLSAEEQEALVSFLNSLTDKKFISP
jgi:cytochrome c peroxidase